jgi:hypothetical protein
MFPGRSLARFFRRLGLVVVLVGSAAASLAGCGSADDTRPAQWSYIYPAIIQPSCATASCHSDFTRRSGVNFGSADLAYTQLVCRHFVVTCFPMNSDDPCNPGHQVAVAPAASCSMNPAGQSQVINQMEANGALRMPPDFALPNADIEKIAEWINLGAQQD